MYNVIRKFQQNERNLQPIFTSPMSTKRRGWHCGIWRLKHEKRIFDETLCPALDVLDKLSHLFTNIGTAYRIGGVLASNRKLVIGNRCCQNNARRLCKTSFVVEVESCPPNWGCFSF